jgi:hypothetical protein
MTKTYIAPTLVAGGDVIGVTQSGTSSKIGESMVFQRISASGTGFYL